jgi:hypothetical protein
VSVVALLARRTALACCAAPMIACGPVEGVPLDDVTSGGDASGDIDASSSSTGAPACDVMLDPSTLAQAYIHAGPFTDIARGTTRQLALAQIVGGYPQDIETCVTWSVTPDTFAMISDVGVVLVADDAPIGAQIVVTANIEDGRSILELDMMVYEPMETPILGFWSEQQRMSCEGGTYHPPSPVGELVFFDNGEFRVTWTPFEAYVDYYGVYTHAPDSGALTMTIIGGNFTPLDYDGAGAAFVDEDGTLELTGMFLGTRAGDEPMVACGHQFR